MIEQKREALDTILMLVCNELQLSATQEKKPKKCMKTFVSGFRAVKNMI